MEHGIKHNRSQKLINFAYNFAKKAHGEQKRKYTEEPYINHPVAVAKIVASVTDDCELICAALLHDVIEDTEVTYEEIKKNFWHHIADLVLEVSDVSTLADGNRAIRKAIDRDHLAKASNDGKTIKLADLIHNSSSICEYDEGFARTYIKEKAELLEVLKEGNACLHKQASDIVRKYYAE